MNKNYWGILIALIMLLSVGHVMAAIGAISWVSTSADTLDITNGQPADYSSFASTTLGTGSYSIALYRAGSSSPIHTYASNQQTTTSGASRRFTIISSDYGNTEGNYYLVLTSVDKYSTDTDTIYLQVLPKVIPLTITCSANPTTGVSPLNVAFNAQANGGTGSYSYKWTFGDNSVITNTQNQMTHVYSEGTFAASVTVIDSNNVQTTANCVGNIVVTKPITPITATCIATPSSGTIPLNVLFNVQANGGTGIYSYTWSFGDDTIGTNQNSISHTYNNANSYNPTVKITDSANNQVTISCGTITINKPIVPLTATCSANPTSGNYPLTSSFNSNVNGGTGAYTYKWTFGDGTIATSQGSASHAYNVDGTYSSTLTITDSNSNSVTANCGQIIVSKPITPITVSCQATPLSGTAPLNVAFNAQVSGGTGTYKYTWNFGDSSTNKNDVNKILAYTYYNAGTFVTSVTVSDQNNNQATANCGTIVVNSQIPPLTASCIATPTSGTSPLNVAFNAQVSGGSGTYSYKWTFADGQVSGSPNSATHTFSEGTYNPTVKITDSANNQVTISCGTITVNKQVEPLTGICTVNPVNGTSPLTVSLNLQPSGGVGPYTYKWRYADGTTNNNPTSTTHTYTALGTYNVLVDITDSANNKATISCGTITVNKAATPLTATCNANPTSGNTPLNVNFNSQVNGGSGTYSYSWTFGDGATSINQNIVSHTYTTAGNYNPKLTITDSQNNVITTSCTDSNGINVIKPAPILNIDSITCFPRVTDGKNQSCSVFITSSDGQIPGNVNINIYYSDGTSFGTCITDKLSGGCEVEKIVHGVGTYTVYATANANGFIGDNDKNPKYTFEVFAQRYNIINLDTYKDSNFYYPEHTFYRGQALYAKFQVYDPLTNSFVTNDIVTAAALVSLPGGRVDLSRITYNGNWYYYKLDAIPLNHDFLGGSNVFAFAFNFTGLTSGQAQVNLTILNNKPTISSIADVYVKIGQTYTVPLNNYGTDLEDKILRWTITNTPNKFSATIDAANILSITGITSGDDSLTLNGYDLDNDYASTTIIVHVLPNVIPSNLTASCSINPLSGNAPLIVTATSQANGGIGQYTYQYSFGDGTVVSHNQNSLAHTYNTAGTYSVSLIVTDSNNNQATANCGVVIASNTIPVNYSLGITCIAMPNNGIAPLNVMFTSIVNNGVGPLTYVYDYGMGYTTTSQDNIAYQTYNTPGSYYPSVHVTDNNGNIGDASCGLIVANANTNITFPIANAGGPYTGYINEPVTFDASQSVGSIINYRWDFGDGTGIIDTTTPTIEHTYTNIRQYDVKLTVFDVNGFNVDASTTATIIEHSNYKNTTVKDVPDKGILIQQILIYGQNGEILKQNDDMNVNIALKNEWGSRLKNIRVIVSIPDLGLETRSTLFDMGSGTTHDESLNLPLYNVKPGTYYVQISVDNDQGDNQVRRIKYREVIVK